MTPSRFCQHLGCCRGDSPIATILSDTMQSPQDAVYAVSTGHASNPPSVYTNKFSGKVSTYNPGLNFTDEVQSVNPPIVGHYAK